MAITLKIKVGKNEVQISGQDEKDLIKQASFWGQLPSACGHCKSDDIGFVHATPGKFEYYFLMCKQCRYEFKFGVRQSDQGLFPKPAQNNTGGWVAPFAGGHGHEEPEEEYQRPPARQANRPAPKPQPRQAVDDDDEQIPW